MGISRKEQEKRKKKKTCENDKGKLTSLWPIHSMMMIPLAADDALKLGEGLD